MGSNLALVNELKLSLSIKQWMCTWSTWGKVKGSKSRGLGPAYHMLWPRHDGANIPLPQQPLGYGNLFHTFIFLPSLGWQPGIIFWRDFTIFTHFFYTKSLKNSLSEKNICAEWFSQSLLYFSASHMRTVWRHLSCFICLVSDFLAQNDLHQNCG